MPKRDILVRLQENIISLDKEIVRIQNQLERERQWKQELADTEQKRLEQQKASERNLWDHLRDG